VKSNSNDENVEIQIKVPERVENGEVKKELVIENMEGMISLKVPEGEMMNVEKEVKGEEGNKGSEVIVNVNGENNGVDNQKEITEIQIIVPEKDEKIKMDENKDNVVKNKDDIKENEDDDSDWEAEFKKNKKN